MRTPRKYTLPPGSIFHFMWRCINGEFMLRADAVKRRYLDTRFRFMKRALGKVRLHSFCLMDNHGLCAAAHNPCYVQRPVMLSCARNRM